MSGKERLKYLTQMAKADPYRYLRQPADTWMPPTRYARQMANTHTPKAHEGVGQGQRQTGGALNCPDMINITTRTQQLIAAVEELNDMSHHGQACYRLYQYIEKYGPITLTAAVHPKCVIYENGMPIASSSYLLTIKSTRYRSRDRTA